MNRPVFIEFAGLPGSGKTTIVKHLLEMQNKDKLDLKLFHLSPLSKEVKRLGFIHISSVIRIIILTLCSNPELMIRLTHFSLQAGKLSSLRMKNIYRFLLMTWQLARLPVAGRQITLLDQGLVQLLGSIALPSIQSMFSGLEGLILCALPGRIDGIVWVECEPEIALARVHQRLEGGKSRFKEWNVDFAAPRQVAMQGVMGNVVEAARDVNLPVLSIVGTDLPKNNAALIYEWIRSLL